MRAPEEVAREVMQALCTNCQGTLCMGCALREYGHDCQDDCPDCCGEVDGNVLAIIRARDAEVAERARAEAVLEMADMEWEERGELGPCTHPHHVHGVTGIPAWWSTECRRALTAAERRLVGPWEPVALLNPTEGEDR